MVDVSIVVPCYKAVDFLDDCIGSIVAQKGVELEILAIEDASPDGTWDKLQELAAVHPQLVIERLPENRGQATARNIAMAKAKGRYVALLDSDDCYRTEDVLRRWVEAADRDQLDMCIAQFTRWFQSGQIEAPSQVPAIAQGVGSAVDAPVIANTNQSWQVLFRREFLAENNLTFSDRLRQREDRLFLVEAFTRAKRIGVTDIDAILYREHENSTMRRVDFDQLAMFNIHMEIMADFMAQARAEGRVGPDFERANAFAYWRQLLEYWTPLFLRVLRFEQEGTPKDITPDEQRAVQDYLTRIMRLTGHCAPLYLDTHIQKPGASEDRKAEGKLDIARLAVETGRRDILLRLLRRWPVHHSDLRAMVAKSHYDWAEDAVLHYLKFARNANYPQERVTSKTPRLGDLVKRVVLHVGLPKTGSSSAQIFLEENRFAMLEKGIYYPIHGIYREKGIRRDRSAGHLWLMRRIVTGEVGEEAGLRLAAEIQALGKPVDTLVLSSENILSHLIWPTLDEDPNAGRDAVRMIVDALGVDQVEIAAVFRRQDAWFQSYFRELTANPFNGFSAEPRTYFDDLYSRGLFDYEGIIRAFEDSGRVSRLHLDGFEKMRAMGGSIPWFLSVIGVDSDDFAHKDARVANESFSDAAAANIRVMKLLHLNRNRAEPTFRRILASEALARSDFTLIRSGDWDNIIKLIDDDIAAFDARFPGEKRALVRGNEATPLLLLPEVARCEPEHIWIGLTVPGRKGAEKPVGEVLDDYEYITESRSWKLTAPMRRALLGVKVVRDKLRR